MSAEVWAIIVATLYLGYCIGSRTDMLIRELRVISEELTYLNRDRREAERNRDFLD